MVKISVFALAAASLACHSIRADSESTLRPEFEKIEEASGTSNVHLLLSYPEFNALGFGDYDKVPLSSFLLLPEKSQKLSNEVLSPQTEGYSYVNLEKAPSTDQTVQSAEKKFRNVVSQEMIQKEESPFVSSAEKISSIHIRLNKTNSLEAYAEIKGDLKPLRRMQPRIVDELPKAEIIQKIEFRFFNPYQNIQSFLQAPSLPAYSIDLEKVPTQLSYNTVKKLSICNSSTNDLILSDPISFSFHKDLYALIEGNTFAFIYLKKNKIPVPKAKFLETSLPIVLTKTERFPSFDLRLKPEENVFVSNVDLDFESLMKADQQTTEIALEFEVNKIHYVIDIPETSIEKILFEHQKPFVEMLTVHLTDQEKLRYSDVHHPTMIEPSIQITAESKILFSMPTVNQVATNEKEFKLFDLFPETTQLIELHSFENSHENLYYSPSIALQVPQLNPIYLYSDTISLNPLFPEREQRLISFETQLPTLSNHLQTTNLETEFQFTDKQITFYVDDFSPLKYESLRSSPLKLSHHSPVNVVVQKEDITSKAFDPEKEHSLLTLQKNEFEVVPSSTTQIKTFSSNVVSKTSVDPSSMEVKSTHLAYRSDLVIPEKTLRTNRYVDLSQDLGNIYAKQQRLKEERLENSIPHVKVPKYLVAHTQDFYPGIDDYTLRKINLNLLKHHGLTPITNNFFKQKFPNLNVVVAFDETQNCSAVHPISEKSHLEVFDIGYETFNQNLVLVSNQSTPESALEFSIFDQTFISQQIKELEKENVNFSLFPFYANTTLSPFINHDFVLDKDFNFDPYVSDYSDVFVFTPKLQLKQNYFGMNENDVMQLTLDTMSQQDHKDLFLSNEKQYSETTKREYLANQLNKEHRLLGYQLKQLPLPEQLNTFDLTDEFSKKIKIAAKPDGSGYYFAIEIKPYSPERLTHVKQNVYFVIDKNDTTSSEQMQSYAKAIMRSLRYLYSDDAFNIIVFDGKLRSFKDNCVYAFDSNIEDAFKFLKKHQKSYSTTSKNISWLLSALNEQASKNPDEVHTVILFSNGASLQSYSKRNQKKIEEAMNAYTKAFSIYPAHIVKKANSRSLERLSKLYRGSFIKSKTHSAFSRYVAKKVKQLNRPVAKEIYVTPICREKQSVKIFPSKNHFSEIYSNAPLVIYGFTNSIHAFDLFIQGKMNHEWMNTKIRVNIDFAENGGADLRKKCMALESKFDHLSQL